MVFRDNKVASFEGYENPRWMGKILGGIVMFQRVGVERETKKNTRMSMEVIVTSCCKLVYFTYLPDLQPTYIGVIVIVHLLSTMDIPVPS